MEEYKNQDLKIDYVTTGNEPMMAFLPRLHLISMPMMREPRETWLSNNLFPTIKKSQSNETKIVGYEDQTDGLIPFATYTKLFQNDALSKMDIIGIHWYIDFLVPRSLSLETAHFLLPDKPIMITETCPGI